MSYFERAKEEVIRLHLAQMRESLEAVERMRGEAQGEIAKAEARLATLDKIAPAIEIHIEDGMEHLRKLEAGALVP